MTEEKLTLNLSSDKYNFIVEGRSIEKIRVFSPLLASYSFECREKNGDLLLDGFDYAASYKLGDKSDISYYWSLGLKTIKIQVPDYLITNLKVYAKTGNVFIRDIILDKTTVTLLKGNVEILNSNCGVLDLDSFGDRVHINNVSGDGGLIKTNTGNIYVYDNFPNETHIFTHYGDIFTSLRREDYDNTEIVMETKKNIITQEVRNSKEFTKRLVMTANSGRIRNIHY